MSVYTKIAKNCADWFDCKSEMGGNLDVNHVNYPDVLANFSIV